jgi:hypothetical protein
MDIFFTDPEAIPLPPDEVRILELKIEPYPDSRRVKVFLELTPFQKKPSGDITISDQAGNQAAAASFVEAITPKLEMTLHLRYDQPGEFTALTTLYYTEEIEDGVQDDRIVVRPNKQIIHQVEEKFNINE